MPCPNHSRRGRTPLCRARTAALGIPLLFIPALFPAAQAQDATNNPASVPAGAIPPPPPTPAPKPAAADPAATVTPRQAREADDAYIDGAKQVLHKNMEAAEHDFERAVQLNPHNRDYALALIVARESLVTTLVQNAAKARLLGDTSRADALLLQASKLDPDNPIVREHLHENVPLDETPRSANPSAEELAATLAGPIEFAPATDTHSVHLRGDPQTVIRGVYGAFGINVSFDASVTSGAQLKLDLDNVTFDDATRILADMAHIIAVPVQPKLALIAKDTQENRDNLMPQIEETIYLPGLTADQMTELANVARNIFDIKQVTTSASSGFMLVRGDERVLRQLNAIYADMLNAGSEVLFDVTLYEIDSTMMHNIGATLPSSAGVFSVAAEAQSIVTANQSLIQQAVSAGLLVLNGTPIQNLIKELTFLVASGAVTATQYSNLLGVFGGGLTFAGLFLGSSSSFSLALNNTDTRMLDALQVRSSNHQPANFRAGTRYPVVTATYSSGVSPTLPASLAGLTINGQSASSLLSQYLGSSTAVNVPQFQYEDLGITLKLTPNVGRTGEVSVAVDMKIEALAGGSINSIPILNNRALTSTVSIPPGQTAMLATLVNTNEIKSLDGLPGLSELPGFQGTDQTVEKDAGELLITITPHIVHSSKMHIASRRLASIHTTSGPG